MDLKQAIMDRRSVRRFTSDPVSEEDVRLILEAGRWAPSWANTQCWRFIVVSDPTVKEALAQSLTPTNRAADALRKAPVAIAVCAELGRAGFKQGQATTDKGDWFMFDCGLAVQNMVLAAHSLGLGTVIVGLLDAKKAGEALLLPSNTAFVALLPVGHPEHKPIAPARRELSELVYYERFGNPQH